MRSASVRALGLGALLLVLGGCVVEGTLDPTGGAAVTLRYRLVSVANLEQMRAQLGSPAVTVTEAIMAPDKQATFRVTTPDVRALSTAPAFGGADVTLADEPDGLRTLRVTVGGARLRLPAPYVAYLGGELRVTLTLPGEIVRSNATQVAGRTATWRRPLGDLEGEAGVFTATFRPAA